MAARHDRRGLYMQGWYDLDITKLHAAIAPGFVFDDPAEPAPVAGDDLAGYMQRWLERAGKKNDWLLKNEVRLDENGILTDWHWWQVIGTNLTGSALVQTSDDGVLFERLAYFDRRTA
jgi:hypothetical protein